MEHWYTADMVYSTLWEQAVLLVLIEAACNEELFDQTHDKQAIVLCTCYMYDEYQ